MGRVFSLDKLAETGNKNSRIFGLGWTVVAMGGLLSSIRISPDLAAYNLRDRSSQEPMTM